MEEYERMNLKQRKRKSFLSLLVCWGIMSPGILWPLFKFLKWLSQPWFLWPFFEWYEQLQNTSNEYPLLKCYFDYSNLGFLCPVTEYLTNTRANTYVVVELYRRTPVVHILIYPLLLNMMLQKLLSSSQLNILKTMGKLLPWLHHII